jgi:PHS family inorganic phosphate transporter-like MFS transporter
LAATHEGDLVAETRSQGLTSALDEVSISRFHLRAVLVSGMGFFTDAYDLFVIGIAATLIKQQWHLDSARLALLTSTMLFAAFLGALVFGRVADILGRKRVYWLVAAIMVAGALGSALSPSFWVLIVFRFVLGFGVGGDYPVSAVLMSEYANRRDRGKLVGMVFSTQALGLIVGPLIALLLLGAGVSDGLAWRIMLGVGAIPAAAVVYLRRKMPESPRYQAQVQGRYDAAVLGLTRFSDGSVVAKPTPAITHRMGLRSFLTNRRWLITLAGTAGCWFLLDYAYYGNTISTPQIIGLISPNSSTMTAIAIQLAIFTVAAVPGYLLGIARMDRIGHRRLQLIGFAVMALCFAVIGLVPGLTTAVAPFLLVYGVSYFFTEFGPNMTTFVMPSELFPVTMRATGHGISAGVGKLGAFIGVFLFPLLQTSLGLRGTLLLTAGISVLGLLLTLVLPEPAGRSLDEVSGGESLFGGLAGGYPSLAESPSAGSLLVDVPSELRPGTPPDRAA